MKACIINISCVFIALISWGQQPDMQEVAKLEDVIEAIVADNEDANVEQLLDDLQAFREAPLNINQCQRADLERLYFLSPVQIDHLLTYRQQYGSILTPFELAQVDGFTRQLIGWLQLFVVFGSAEASRRFFPTQQEMLLRAIRQIELQKGYKEPRKYQGSPEKLYLRYRFSSSTVRAGLTAEKDAGESFFSGANPEGFDYYSAFATIGLKDDQHQLFLGDYLARFGQGLVAWQGFSLSKSAEVNQVARFGQGLRTYSSTDENNYLRGLGAAFHWGNFGWSPFVSYKKFDANREQRAEETVFTSFQSSGLHRTVNEIDDKNSVSALTIGTNLTYTFQRFSLGVTGVYNRYGLALDRKDADYNQFLFEGRQLTTVGANYQWGVNRYYFYGEAAWSGTKGFAFIQGLEGQLADQIKLSLLYRSIGKKYNAPLGSGFTENSRLNDEQGLYLGATVEPLANVSVKLYADLFSHRWIKYTTVAPAKGAEYLLQVNYQLSDEWEIYGRYFYEEKPVKSKEADFQFNLEQKREKWRVHLSGAITDRYFLRSRLEWIDYQHEEQSKGWLVFQDFGWRSKSNNNSAWLRVAYFYTDDYDSRIYTYENDLLYQFAVPAFYGKGMRFYLNGKVKICEKIDFWMKLARSWFIGVDTIGTGYSQLDANSRTEVKFQLRFKF